MRDTGFADRSMIPALLRRIRLRTAIAAARTSVDALADLLDQQCETLGGDDAALGGESFGLPVSYHERGFERVALGSAQRNALREDELLEGVKLIAQLDDQRRRVPAVRHRCRRGGPDGGRGLPAGRQGAGRKAARSGGCPVIWYLAPCVCGLRRMTLSQSAIGMIVQTLTPPSLAHAIRSGRFPA